MAERLAHKLEPKAWEFTVQLQTCNSRCLPTAIGDSFFHVVIDKGTTDSLLKSKDGHQLAESSMTEIFRVLHPKGVLWQITDEDPDVRLLFLQSLSNQVRKTYTTSFEVLLSDNINDYFLYTTTTGENWYSKT